MELYILTLTWQLSETLESDTGNSFSKQIIPVMENTGKAESVDDAKLTETCEAV